MNSAFHSWAFATPSDTDVCARQGQLDPAVDLARKENIHLGLSTPSAEVWLLLHFRDRPGLLLDSKAAEHAVGTAWGRDYDKSEQTFVKLWPALKPRIPTAVARAAEVRKYHLHAGTPFPQNPSTELDLLVLALNVSVQPQLRIIH